MWIFTALRILLISSVTVHSIFHTKLGKKNVLYWELNYSKEEFVAEVHTRDFQDHSTAWVGIGFSNRGDLSDGSGDYCIVWKKHNNGHKTLQISDVHLQNGTDMIKVDQKQDCTNFRYIKDNDTLKWTYKRKFVTCDYEDYALEEGTTHLHWVYGEGPLYDINGVSIGHVKDKGFERVRFLKNEADNHPSDSEKPWKVQILNQKVKVPSDETTYWCHVFKLPEKLQRKHHIIQFGAFIQKGNEALVHHMEVFHCLTGPEVQIPAYSGPCPKSPPSLNVCSQVLGAWAMGAEPLKLPAAAGYPIGGKNYNPYVRLEVHYNNPGKKSDWVDSSGMELWVTDKLRQYDAGIMELGLEYIDKNAIPPHEESFPLSGICNPECTSIGFPEGGITVFASQLHTHLTGIRVVTRHFSPTDGSRESRNIDEGHRFKELPFLNWDNHYSTHFQEIRLLKVAAKVMPGDMLVTTCMHNTTDRENMTLGGFAIVEEMCVNYIHYYPKCAVEVCKSSVSWKSLRRYFDFMKTNENQNVDPEGPVSQNYNAIQWTPFRSRILSNFYEDAAIDMQCNKSDGSRFPGSWSNMPLPRIARLPPPRNPNDDCFLEQAISIQ